MEQKVADRLFGRDVKEPDDKPVLDGENDEHSMISDGDDEGKVQVHTLSNSPSRSRSRSHNQYDDGYRDKDKKSPKFDVSPPRLQHGHCIADDGREAPPRSDSDDDKRLRGAFLLAADSDEEGSGGEPCLPAHGPACLAKFATISASLGLKTSRERLREDFEQVVRSNRLLENENDPGRPWRAASSPDSLVRGFTFEVFRQYYLSKIQGELMESDMRQAWDDLHYGTGSKRMLDTPGSGQERGQGKELAGGATTGRAYVTRAELHNILTREGESLTDEEVDELLRECRPDEEGRIVYEGYRRMLIDPSL